MLCLHNKVFRSIKNNWLIPVDRWLPIKIRTIFAGFTPEGMKKGPFETALLINYW